MNTLKKIGAVLRPLIADTYENGWRRGYELAALDHGASEIAARSPRVEHLHAMAHARDEYVSRVSLENEPS